LRATPKAEPTTPPGQFSHRGLADDNRSGRLQAFDDGRIAFRREIAEHHRTVGGGHVAGLHLVLQQHGDTVQRADRSALAKHRVQPVGFVEGAAVHGLCRSQLRSGLIIGFDTSEIERDQLPAAQISGLQFGVNPVDGGFLEVERRLGTDRSEHRAKDGDADQYGRTE
jgi:hypothetical protein